MKYFSALLLFALTISLFSCEDVIEVEVQNTTPRLVIDAQFNIFTALEAPRLEGGVKLSMSANYFDEELPVVKDALVTITHLNSGLEYPLLFDESIGMFVPDKIDFLTDFNSKYELSVLHQGQAYTGSTVFVPVPPILKAVQGTKTLFSGDETEIILSFQDFSEREDFYLYDFGQEIYRPIEDRFFQGEEFVFSHFYSSGEVKVGDIITIKAHGVEEQYYNYFNLILTLTDSNGGPFQSLPASSRGNILNVTQPDNYPLGYFLISESDQKQLLIEELK
ncbi:MAG: DUF4249 family protein [Flavobacteriaceae bacterium]|nr:DUF4249 family protein [Flavobacteriaceae bacterium]MCO4854516.1 DUF4249 family protein [Flavobacteriaceae bacterium]MDA9252696.1 DUF4249 domain-containing protein [Flavobacteriaceae bacterium]MDA9322929.1 DUF4249 domain-containing protein [Flavobacteriaceae bacterium]MDA9928692.1 DUF4249 domain-containing protein [Flavobacteriaceae bacterium]